MPPRADSRRVRAEQGFTISFIAFTPDYFPGLKIKLEFNWHGRKAQDFNFRHMISCRSLPFSRGAPPKIGSLCEAPGSYRHDGASLFAP